MVEKFNEKANALAHEYWRLKGITAESAGGNRLKEIEKLLEKGIGGMIANTGRFLKSLSPLLPTSFLARRLQIFSSK